MVTPKFLASNGTSFHADLKKRINNYFVEINAKPKGNIKLYTKAIILVVSLLAVYIHLVFFTPPVALAILECILLGAIVAGIGFNVMHDGAHGSFSSRKWVNNLAGLSLNFVGANVFMWKTKHNVIHHTYTNIDEVDDDLNARPFLRLCENQKHYKIHRFQHYYFIAAYSLLYLYWVFFTDYKKYFTGKVGDIPIKKMKLSDHISFWGFKAFFMLSFVLVPIYFVGFVPWLVGFLIFGLFTGILISIVFQLAHSVEEASFPIPDSAQKIEDEWAIHQLKTTANFATKNKIVSWFTGGLNFQIEHHLFPNISHIHYPEISKIVKETCRDYNIPYIEFPKVRMAVASHYSHLRQLGVG